jgi:Fic family protein
MAKIRVPEPLKQLLLKIKHGDFGNLLEKYGVTDSQGRYLHWDEFQWRVDKGDDVDTAWYATRFARKILDKDLNLLKSEGDRCFSYCVPDSLFAQLHAIDKLSGGGRTISEGELVSAAEKNGYLVKSLISEEAITSSQLEGASTTREIAKEMLEKNLLPKDKSQQMIFNNFLLMKKAVEQSKEELSLNFILELHQLATYKAIENQATSGEFRKDNRIFVSDIYGENTFQPPDWQTIEARLKNLCEFANADHSIGNNFIHPIVKAIILHFMIAYIHPFGDGNGRTARAIFYWSMLRSGYWLFEYVSISKPIQEHRGKYDKAFIHTETDEFDLTYFLYNQVEMIEKAVKSLNEYVDKKKRDFYEFMEWVEKSPITKNLQQGHLQILKAAVKSPGREFTVKQVAMEFDVTENTARSYLNKLVDKDLLIKAQAKTGKTVTYLAPANLKTRLKL